MLSNLDELTPQFYHSTEKFCAEAGGAGNATYESNAFDLMTFRDHHTTVFEDDDGNKKEVKSNERFYVPCEITWLLKSLGYRRIEIFGAKLGAYSRSDKLTAEDFEMLVVAER